jgi:pimeloyl-ACP methyl ester carboxylesterase
VGGRVVVNLAGMPQVEGVRHRGVDVGGASLHLAEAGDGPPLLLLHGWPEHWFCWRHLIGPLAAEHRVLAPDLRGWGWSDAPPGAYAKADFAADIIALMDAEGLDRVRVLAHDWGAYTAYLLALEHPERIERLMVLDMPPPWFGAPRLRQLGLPLLLSYQALLATSHLGPRLMTRSNGFIRTMIRAGSGPGMRWTDAELDVYADRLREPARAAASSACYRSFLTDELPATFRKRYRPEDLAVPTLLATGGASALMRILGPVPSRNLRVETIPGAGHFLPEEKPERVLELARGHLAG